MTMNLSDLERLAKAATPGPWRWDPGDCSMGSVREDHWETVLFADLDRELIGDGDLLVAGAAHGGSPRVIIDDKDAAFIAACDPSTVLKLIVVVRSAAEDLARATNHASDETIAAFARIGLEI